MIEEAKELKIEKLAKSHVNYKSLPVSESSQAGFERRITCPSEVAFYDRLSLAQKCSVSKLTQYGYLIKFIRGKGRNSVAILVCDERVATVHFAGEINLTPNIKLRK